MITAKMQRNMTQRCIWRVQTCKWSHKGVYCQVPYYNC